jgi:OOP family OmpA-OmpF porin
MLTTNRLKCALFVLCITGTSAMAAEGIYVSGNVGAAFADDMPSADTNGYVNTDLKPRNTAFRIALGYAKNLNPKFSLGTELGYNNYGSDEYTAEGANYYYGSGSSLEYKYTAIDLLLKPTFHINKKIDVYGKIGVAHEMVDVSGDVVSNSSENLPEFGLGMSYLATQSLGLDLAVTHTSGQDIQFNSTDDNNVPSITSVMFGLNYYFA